MEMDDLMIEIKEKSLDNKVDAISAEIKDDTIRPGLIGKEVDVNKSYYNMKRINEYNENMIIYSDLYPKISIKNNYDKYVIGGIKKNKEVSLILVINENTDMLYLRNLAKNKNISFNFFINSKWFSNNNDLLTTLVNEGHNIGNLGEDNDYSSSTYIWMDTILKKIVKQKNNYCYLENRNVDYLNICALNKNYTIMPSIIIKDNLLKIIKEKIENGSIISIYANRKNIEQLNISIDYIQSRGYKIVSLNDLIDEI